MLIIRVGHCGRTANKQFPNSPQCSISLLVYPTHHFSIIIIAWYVINHSDSSLYSIKHSLDIYELIIICRDRRNGWGEVEGEGLLNELFPLPRFAILVLREDTSHSFIFSVTYLIWDTHANQCLYCYMSSRGPDIRCISCANVLKQTYVHVFFVSFLFMFHHKSPCIVQMYWHMV